LGQEAKANQNCALIAVDSGTPVGIGQCSLRVESRE
jgi:hypothetical protein